MCQPGSHHTPDKHRALSLGRDLGQGPERPLISSDRSGGSCRLKAQLQTARGAVCVLRELLHVREKRLRLANEESHGGQKCKSAGGGTVRVRWPND